MSSTDNLFAGITPGANPDSPKATDPANSKASPPAQSESKETNESQPTELDMLKNRAKLMGIKFSNNIGLEALKAKVTARQSNEQDDTDEDGNKLPEKPAEAPGTNQTAIAEVNTTPVIETTTQLRQRLMEEQMKLVRLRITNLDPKKKDLAGEIFTVANEYIGTVRKFIAYGAATDNGYHVPFCLYNLLKEKEMLTIRVRTVRGQEVIERSYVREFALEVLPQLTEIELAQLAAAQAAGNNID